VPELKTFPKHLVPRDIAIQIRSYYRIQWPHVLPRSATLWSYSPDNPLRPINFVLMEGEALVSHTEANWREIELDGQKLICGGLSGVFTYPAWRGSGLAKDVVRAATERINQSDADLAILFTGPRLRNFYIECGWTPMDTARILFGDAANPQQDKTGQIMMLFPSAKGRALQQRLLSEPLYVGPVTW
jgi:GNAT superfamily N-acetyltransferase